jgi:Spy/CpxP family protein refolding chaperone
MADANYQSEERNQNQSTAGEDLTSKAKRSRTRRWLLFALVPAAAVSALLLPRALAWHGWHRGFHSFGSGHCDLSDQQVRGRLERRLGFILKQLEADEQQEREIRRIAEQTVDEMVVLHQKGEALRERFSAALLGEQVDHQELERVREQLRALADQASRLAFERLAAVSEVLTPEQRSRIYDFFEAVHH